MAATALEGVPPPSARPSVVPSFDVGCRSLSLALSLPPSLPLSLRTRDFILLQGLVSHKSSPLILVTIDVTDLQTLHQPTTLCSGHYSSAGRRPTAPPSLPSPPYALRPIDLLVVRPSVRPSVSPPFVPSLLKHFSLRRGRWMDCGRSLRGCHSCPFTIVTVQSRM